MDFVIGVGYGERLDRVQDLIVDALSGLDVVRSDPPPTALVSELNASTVDLVARFWVDSGQFDAIRAVDAGIRAVESARDDDDVIEKRFEQRLRDACDEIEAQSSWLMP